MIRRTLKTLLFLLAAIPLGGIGLAALIAGWVLVGTLAITPLAVPALVAFRVAIGGVARLDATLAKDVEFDADQGALLAIPRGIRKRAPVDLGLADRIR